MTLFLYTIADLVRPICLVEPGVTDDFVGTEAHIAGWGKTSDGQ